MFLNLTCKILGTTNVIEAILASTYIMCSKLLEHFSKGDTFLCSLEAGYLTIRNSIIRNKHIFNLVDILNQIKNKTGLYTIMEGSKYDWLEYASYDTTHIELFVTPKKDVINQTIMTFLDGLWATKWENLKGHAQTKYWCMGPRPYTISQTAEHAKGAPWMVCSIFHWPWLVEKTSETCQSL